MPVTVLQDRHEVAERLGELGLNEEILRNAIIAGDLARAGCTENAPPLFRGVMFWGMTTSSLREQLSPLGWEKDDTAGFATVRNRDTGVAIVVSSGDMDTGNADPSSPPKTKYRKGTITIAAVDSNAAQMELFSVVQQNASQSDEDERDGLLTWVLLVNRAPGSREIRSELSLPSSVDDDGRIGGWAERIKLTPIPYGVGNSTPPPPSTGDVDVPVARKTPPEE